MNHSKKYDNIIMSWSCIGDFILVSQSFNNLIKSEQVKRAVVISHDESLSELLEESQSIILLYPTKKVYDLVKLFFLVFKKNIFILQDMPSHNLMSKQIRLFMGLFLTIRPCSRLVFLIDKRFKIDVTSRISKLLTKYSYNFDTAKHVHISQNILDILYELKITDRIECNYSLKIKNIRYEIKNVILENSIVIHPFASSLSKSMSKEWWLDLTNMILEKYSNKKIIIIGSEKDFTDSEFIRNSRINIINLAGKISLPQSLYIIKNCEFIFCAESGPSNFAAFYRKQQIVLWFTKNTNTYYMTFNPNASFIFNNNTSNSKVSEYAKKSIHTITPNMCFEVFNKKMENR